MSVGTSQVSLQFLQQTSTLSNQIVQTQQDNAQQTAVTSLRRAGKNTVHDQEAVISTLNQQGRRGQAVDMLV
jgi:hypothetical protein